MIERRIFWLAVSFLAGSGTMILEITAPRLMQPYFGASTFVWTNVIGVILLALALGYELGGRMAARGASHRAMGWILVAAALFALVEAFGFSGLAEALLPDSGALVDLGPSRRQLQWASLAAAAFLFAPPVFLLASLPPQIVARLSALSSPGKAAGDVLMWGTLGSLLGTFLPTYLVIPVWGSRVCLLLAVTLLGLPAIALLLGRRRGTAAASAVALLLLPLVGGPDGPLRGPLEGEVLVLEKETPYQYIRVVEAPAHGDGLDPLRDRQELLRIDEGVREFHSVGPIEGRADSGGKYYDLFALLPGAFPEDRLLDVAILGAGAGTTSRLLDHFWPGRFSRIVDVELDPEILALAERFDPARKTRPVQGVAMDGRGFLRLCEASWDLILVDAYARQVDIPFHMTTVEFWRLVRRRLKPDGLVALNVSAPDVGGELIQSLARSMRAANLHSLRSTPVPFWGNVVLWASPSEREGGWGSLKAPESLRGIHARAARFDLALRPGDQGILLRDDHAPVAWLTERSLEGQRP